MKRSDTVSRVHRKVIENVKVNTVYGTSSVKKVRCMTCGESRTLNDFYLDSRSGDIRNQCITCWDEYKGRTKPKYIPSSDLYNMEK